MIWIQVSLAVLLSCFSSCDSRVLINLRSDDFSGNGTDSEVRFHIRGPEYYAREVGQGSSITCSIAAPEIDDTFEMYVNGIRSSDLCAEDSPWCSAGFNKSIYTYDNGTVETSVEGLVYEFTSAHNETYIKCTSYKYSGSISEWISLRPDNSTDNNTEVRFHIRGPEYYAREVGQGSSITCSIAAPEIDDTFEMHVNRIPFSDLCAVDSPWCSAGFKKCIYTYDNGTVETFVEGFVDEFTSGHNETYIECTSYKYSGSISEWISLRPDNSTDNNPESELSFELGESKIESELKPIKVKKHFKSLW
ncbi:hypothetical protein ACHWQZ_G004096 [Mnemiopsis leidyi]